MLKVHTNIIKLLFLSAGLLATFNACSPEATGLFGQGYHNTTARYNAYFLARQKLEEVEKQIVESHQRNFNQLLYIYPPLDTVKAKQYAEPLQEAMKTASLAIERHKNSKWVDDSYLLVGKARFYGREMTHAVETFKYVNTKSKDDPTRHKALIFLMRTFIDEGQLNNAKGVADFLRKEKLNKENERDYHLVASMLYRQREEWERVAAHLEKAVENTKKGLERATYRFMLGQLYQQAGKEEEAYKNFRQVLRNNPDYELSFYARLHMAQVANLAKEGDEKKIRRYFSKLLKDRKNKEYRDKIYYELGNFELRQGNLEAALENYRKSIRASINNERQKSYAYRKLAELYYDAGNYRLSKAYYDSTATSTPQDEVDYAPLQERQKVMANLVSQLDIIEEKDSVLRLASMDKAALEAYLDEIVREEEKAKALALRKNKEKITQVNVRTGFNTVQDKFGVTQEEGNTIWYFYNPSLMSIGQAEFVKRWGNRPLEDNWRRTNRGRANTSTVTQAQAQEEFKDDTAPENNEERLAARRVQLYESLPLAAEQQIEARQQVETAFYNLGNIFNFDLKEFSPTVDAYTSLLDRFLTSEYRPEVLFNLYVLYLNTDAVKAAQYKEMLIRDHPQSTYAKSLINPDYEREEDMVNNQVKQLYAQAYKLYKRDSYTRADSLVQAGLQQYPTNPFSNRLDLLRIMIIGQTKGVQQYQEELNRFIKANENTELQQYASELLQTSYKFAEDSTSSPKGPIYEESFDQPHYFVVVYNQDKERTSNLLRVLDSYNSQEEASRKLKATTIVLSDKKSMVFVSQFPDKTAAMKYFRALERNNVLSGDLKDAVSEYFVISKDNFSTLYNSKDVGKYISFFQKFYY